MVRRDPALVVALVGARGGALASGEGLLFGDGCAGLLGRTLGLREEGLDPGLVDEVAGTGEAGREEEIQEDAVKGLILAYGNYK